MARPESQAIAGFVPVPPVLYPSIARILRVTFASARDELVVADPCAGEGAALLGLAACWVRGSTCAEKTRTFTEGGRWEDRGWQHDPDDWNDNAKLFACEMEAEKAGILERVLRYRRHMSDQNRVVHGDAFQLVLHAGDGVHVLWHNPPYDHDREHKRLEERFLRRFGPLVGVGGYLFHFVPFYALGASADTIAKLFEDVVCYRLPEPHFSVYKQVVLVGRRRLALATPDPATAAKVRAWSASAQGMPELPLDGLREPVFTLSTKVRVDNPAWTLGALDITGVLDAYEPWAMTDRAGRTVPLPNVEPEGPYTEILSPMLRLACAPRPGHLADACGAGVLSGVRLSPDPGQRGPRLLLKGIHRRTFRHLGWKEVKGERVAEERQHHPELNLTVLDLAKGKYHRLIPSVEPTNERDVSRWTVGDLLLRYSGGMLAAMRERCELIYDRERAEDRDMKLWPVSPDPLFDAQADAVRASLKLLAEPDRAVVVLGQIGVGKTRIALTTAWHQLGGRGRILVLCPPTLVSEWQKEVAKILPDARTVVVESITDLDDLAASPPEGIEVAILTKEKAKLGHELAGVPICPRCGVVQKASPETLAEKRALCETVHYQPANGAARLAARVADGIGAVFPDGQLADVVRRVGGRVLRAVNGRTGDWRARMKVVRSMARSLRRLVCRTAGSDTRQTLSFAWWSALHAVGDEAFMVREIRALFHATLSDREEYGPGKDVREIAARATLLLPPSSPWIRALLTEMESFSGRTYSGRFTPLTKVGDVLKANAARRRGEKIQDYWLTAFGAVGDVPTFGDREMGSDKALSFAIERLCAVATWTESAPCYEPLYQATPKPRRIPIAKYLLRKHPNLFDFMVLDECFVAGTKVSGQPIESLRVGDVVDSFDEQAGTFVKRQITRLWVRPATALVRLTFADGAVLVCTPNHPILTTGGWVAAGRLTPSHEVISMGYGRKAVDRPMSHVRQHDHQGRASGGETTAHRASLLQHDMRWSVEESSTPGPSMGRDVPALCHADGEAGQGSYSYDEAWARLLFVAVQRAVPPVHPTPTVERLVRDLRRASCVSRRRTGLYGEEAGVCLLRKSVRTGGASPKNDWAHLPNSCQPTGKQPAHEGQQPNEGPSCARQNERQLEGAYVSGPWRQRQGDRAADEARDCSRMADGGRGVDGPGAGAIPIPAEPLQGGCWVRGAQARGRSRRQFPQDEEVEVLGPTQGGDTRRTRVASVEVLERGSDGGFGPVCPDGLVYNLEVEETHTYVAEGVVVHNCHVFANADSAQSKAAQRLLSLRLRKRTPVMALSGSIMNGYARSLFVLLWHLSAAFRAEFDYDDAGEFERRYGFLVQVVEQVDENKKRVAYGKQSDRVTERTRTTGAAPGVLPTVPLRWLLPISVTIQLSDLEHELPPCRERIVFVQPTEEQRDRARRMEDKLFAQMASDRFKAGRAGRLFGALANLPRYYDHATSDVGNVPDGSWTIAYPEDAPDVTPAERVVTSVEGFAPAASLPGEAKLVEELRAALAEGRRFVVATTRTDLGKRVARALRAELGVDVALLDTKKVKAADRRDWVDGVRASGAAGMVCNPAALPMGLNNLVGYFSVVVFYDDPNSDPTLLRQFRGRFVRIGQTGPVDVLIFVYEGTLQQDANDHLQKKRVVATATDGLDASAAFEVAGVGDGAVFEADLGKALYRLRAGQG